MKQNRHDPIEEKLKDGLHDLDRITTSAPAHEDILRMIAETRKRQRRELMWFIIVALCLLTVTILVFINNPILYAAGQLLFFIIAGITGLIYRRGREERQHD